MLNRMTTAANPVMSFITCTSSDARSASQNSLRSQHLRVRKVDKKSSAVPGGTEISASTHQISRYPSPEFPDLENPKRPIPGPFRRGKHFHRSAWISRKITGLNRCTPVEFPKLSPFCIKLLDWA